MWKSSVAEGPTMSTLSSIIRAVLPQLQRRRAPLASHVAARRSVGPVGILQQQETCWPQNRFFSTEESSDSSSNSSSDSSSSVGSDRLHSTDIAFKPAESGWGSGGSYTKNYDSIFSSTTKKKMNRHEEKCPALNSDGDATKKNTEKGS